MGEGRLLFRRQSNLGPVGLDIGASSVRMLQLGDHDGEPFVQAAACFELPPAASPEERAELLPGLIRDALGGHAFYGRDVVAGLGSTEFQVKNLRLPTMPPEEMETALEFEVQDRFELGPEGGQFRYMPAGEVRHGNEMKEEVIVLATKNDVIQARLGLLQKAGLRPTAIDVSPCAVARSFVRFLRRSEDANAVNVFLEVGRRGTAVIMLRGTDISFLKVIESGGAEMNAAVAKVLNLSEPQAAELRVQIMRESAASRVVTASPVSEEIKSRVADAVRPIAERITRDLQLCLRYFAVTFRGQRPDGITLVGGEAHEPALKRAVAQLVDAPCTIGDPLRGVHRAELAAGSEARTLQPAWTVAMGLALRGTPWVRGARKTGCIATASAAA